MEHDIGKGHTIPGEVQADLVFRNQKPGTYNSQLASVAGLKFDQRIVVTNLADILDGRKSDHAFEKLHPKVRAWAEAWFPGYSKDGTQAVVRAWVGPSDHGAVVTAFLEKSGEKWFVKWHYLARFV